MKQLRLIAPLVCVALVAFLSGCGSDKREGSTPPQIQASQSCLGCHSGTASRVTGASVATDWLRSAHASAAGGAGCDDCHHATQLGHPQNGSIPPLPNDSVCTAQCHTNTVAMSTQRAHFANQSASYLGFPLSRLNLTLVNPVNTIATPGTETATSWSSCNGCHNPHDPTTLLTVNRQWAQSGHGDTTSEAFDEEPFVKFSGGTCNRCHSATGFRYYMTVGVQRVITPALLGAYSSAKEVISCNACHTDYSWRRLSSDSRVAFQVFSTPYVRSDAISKRIPGSNFTTTASTIGDSQLCVPCHAGRTGARVGAAISLASPTTAPFDSHYFPAAATMYGKIGFINFTSLTAVLPAVTATTGTTGYGAIAATTYGQSLITNEDISGGVTSTHRRLGTPAINGDSHSPSFFTPGHLDANGPCVVCHMTAGHTLTFENTTFAQNTYNQVCINCHTSERGTPLNATNFMDLFVRENRDQMFDALALAVRLLETNYGISINLTDDEALETPQDVSYVFTATGRSAGLTGVTAGTPITGTNWAAYLTANGLSNLQVYKLKGAMFNIILNYKENSAFLHARTLTRRLIYDSVDFLDDGLMNQSAGTTAQAVSLQGNASSNRVFGKFVKDLRAFVTNTDGPLYGTTTPSMTYLIGFDRTTGAWTPPQRERP
ncbi:hypothetical protein GMST_28980 [Geomonas silvestris]|uniref:Uncharacterized protein n=1 Tax=Geomonas silvestris TaxID=2740184 RepID=A0A6V8MLF2_9BACT|nr:hypothetical protein [Geomonas silvestris]GFO60573.1 hypothetical protein GMST_28980 [Geomonas silvestris]